MSPTEQRVRETLGPSFIEYHPGQSKVRNTAVTFACSCGTICTRAPADVFKGKVLCHSCVKASKPSSNRVSESKIQERLAQDGANLLSVEIDPIHKTTLIHFSCACGELHQTRWNYLVTKQNRSRAVCSECAWKGRNILRGAEHPNYVPERHLGRPCDWYANSVWHDEVRKLADFTCQISGKRGGDLSAHHLASATRYPHLACDLSNGVCITRELHKEFHSEFGFRSFTPQDFQAFYFRKTGRTFEIAPHILQG